MIRAEKRSKTARLSGALGWLLVALLCCADSAPDDDAPRDGLAAARAIAPSQRVDSLFLAREVEIRGLPAREQVELVFLGDSITQRWESEGRYAWNRYYAPRRAANFGIDGDRARELLWRVRDGDFEGMDPKGIVLLIGTNDTSERSADEIARVVEAVTAELRSRLPRTRILLLGLLPKHPLPDSPARLRVGQVNARLRTLADRRSVRYADFGSVFTRPDGSIREDLMPDYLHPGPSGYARWAEAMEGEISRLLSAQP